MIAQLDTAYIKARPSKAVSRLVSYAFFEGRPLTTRGRWINPLVFAHFALERRLPILKQVRQPIFIVGTGRSGTTILGKILSMHSQVGFLNEPKALWHAACPGEDLIGSYDRGQARYRLGADAATDTVMQSLHRLFGAYLAAVASSRVVDKYPELVFRVPFVRAVFPDARFIFLVRNGWDTVRSIDHWSERLGQQADGEVHDWWGVDARKWHLLVDQIAAEHKMLRPHLSALRTMDDHVNRAALEWALTMHEGLAQAEVLPELFYLLRYEDLTRRPEHSLNALLDFCNLPSDGTMMDYGTQVLSAAPARDAATLHPAIAPLFNEMMNRLGYK